MLPDPMHPAIVHLPIALALLLPLLAGLCAWVIRSALLPARAWSAIVLLALLLVVGSWAALETGESEEDRVERYVAEAAIEAHEEAAEVFTTLAVVLFVVTAVGMAGGRTGRVARTLSVVAALAVLASGMRVGHLGGRLVYAHGAADAYVTAQSASARSGSLAVDDADSD